MNKDSFLKSKEWLLAKTFLIEELADKPMKIKTEGLNAEAIAVEVRAAQMAAKAMARAIRKFEMKELPRASEEKPYR